jgi:alpha-L-rhamnosidase
MLHRYRVISLSVCAVLIVCGLTVVPTAEWAQGAPPAPLNLRCEYLKNPVGIDVLKPRFSWIIENPARGEGQSAYELLVASASELLSRNQGDQWDSGKVSSEDSAQVVYAGKALESGQTYYWKVRFWNQDGHESEYSPPARFGMGLLSRDEWKGQWIGGANQLRTEFQIPDAVTRARAYICGVGYYELRINGRKVGKKVLDPAWTTFDKRDLYSTYDVTRYLERGGNAVGFMLGEGWYKSRALIFQLNIELPNGKTMSVASTPAWKAKDGPITSDSVWDGETYDARLETPGWDRPGFDDTGWSAAKAIEGPKGVLSTEMMPAIRVTDTLVPVKMTNPKPGVYVFDMGQNMSGWAQLRVRGPRGAAVKLRFAELVFDDGNINRENIRTAKSRDIYTLRGEGEEIYEPRFTYHGFRYVEVTGFPGTPSLDSIRGRVVHTAVETTGSFVASKQILNQIQKLVYWSQLTNLFSVPTDCDQRNERMGWMGDAQVTAEEAMMNFDMAAFYTNFVRDIRDAQKPDGEVPDTVPHGYGQYPADPAWGTAYPLLCWYMWEQYGDRRILEENYDGLKKYVEFLRSKAADNVLRYSYYGDWVAIEHTPGAVISDFYFYYDTRILANVAKILGKTEDAATYSSQASEIKQGFNKAFYNPETGDYANGSQTAQALPLFLDLVSDLHLPSDYNPVLAHLTNDITYGQNTHLTTGFIGVKYLLPVLTGYGRSDLAYKLATQTTYPSWGYMIERGATTLWELWQEETGPSMNSHDHIMFGSVGAWFYTALGGINLSPDGAGYRHIRIEPNMVEDLHAASATMETIRGRVSSTWARMDDGSTLEVDVPAGSDAVVVVPKPQEITGVIVRESDKVVWENGKYVPGDPGIRSASSEKDGRVVFAVSSGHYAFRLSGE